MSYLERVKEKISIVGKESLKAGEIPSIAVWGDNIPEAWENATLATWEYGTSIPTQYDQDIDPESKDATPESKDATVMIVITDPMAEPRIHKSFPDEIRGLEQYRQQVVEGIHDNRVRDGGWSYSYYDRVKNWPGRGSWEKMVGSEVARFDLPHINQIDEIVNKLSETPYSRRAQAITWVPFIDGKHHEPPCLQRIWCRVVQSQNSYLLEMNTHWRSRDAFKAAFMNMYALTDLQRKMAADISNISGKNVGVGRYVDVSDSYHIYGSYIRSGEMSLWLESLEKRNFEKRTLRTDDPIVQEEFAIARKNLEKEK